MKVTTTKTKEISDILFEQILKTLECDTLTDQDCIAFSGVYSVDQFSKRQTYKIEFFGCDGYGYELMIPEHNNYVKNISFIGEPSTREPIHFSKAQKSRMQALISKKVVEVKEDRESAKTAHLREAIGFNPYDVFGLKEADFF